MIVRSRGGSIQLRDSNSLSALVGHASTSSVDRMNMSAGMSVTSYSVKGIPAINLAVRVAAEAIANLDLCVWSGDDFNRKRITSSWQAKLLANPNDQQTPYDFRQTIEESLSYRGNAYIWKLKDPRTQRVAALYALHPDQLRCFFPRNPKSDDEGNVQFYVGVMPGFVDPLEAGYGFYRVGRETILHIRGFGDGGMVIAPSPVELFQQSLGVSLAKINHEAAMYSRGTAARMAITFPGMVTEEQGRQWQAAWQEAYAGPENSSKTPVIGGGATITPIGLTMADAQFVESMQFDVDTAARIMNVQSSLLGGGVIGRSSGTPLTPEHEQDRWLRYGLQSRTKRIEAGFFADPDLFPAGSPYYPMFDTNRFLRGDLQTEAAIAAVKVQTGQWTVNESRARDGMPPIPGGDVPQLTPVGGAPNPDSVQVDNTKH